MPASVIDVLQEAVKQLEQSKEFQAADPAVLRLCQQFNEAIVKFQAQRDCQSNGDGSVPTERRNPANA